MPRFVWLILVLAMLAATVGAVLTHQRKETDEGAKFSAAVRALARLEREIRVRAAMGDVQLNGRGWPMTIDPAWFGDDPPLNPLVENDRAWIEIASSVEAELADPAIRQSVSRDVAGFWYNPASGIIRARVGLDVTDANALNLYNRLNHRELATLFGAGQSIDLHRAPPTPRTSSGVTAQATDTPSHE